ncbi:ML domain containing protein [Tylopilus felleus]
MVRLLSLSLLTVLAGTALASPTPEQQILSDPTAHTLQEWSYHDCGYPVDPIHIKSIKLSPDPPQPGHDLTVTVTGTADEPVEEGAYADVTVKLGLIKLLQKQFDVCKEARAANATVQCPVEEGDYVVSHTVALPREIPPAKFAINIRGYNKDDGELLCLDLKIDFMKFPF